MTPGCHPSAPRKGCAGEPIHQVEPAVEQRDCQRDAFRRGQGRKLRTTMSLRLLVDRPLIRRRVTWHGLHHRPPRCTVKVKVKAMECSERVEVYERSLCG